ncbi:hypothetical protein UFOVP1624_39 [uncultured Caudovirales phage]|uniref:Uncharacterized protein n=1 Tax=uncultured Caudovirales phage TaxID=2100421 RepID=A0A6J5SZA1_9CAUD|nr:hypothetical protein UFOVP1624_39 [uncultured Caudovirales phage]
MTREAFIKKWLGNLDKQYTEQCKDEIRADLDVLISQAHKRITRIKGIEYAPTAFERQTEIDKGGQTMKQTAVEWLIKIYLQTNKIDSFDIEQAKEMEKQQIIDAVNIGFEEGSKFPEDIKLNNAEQYYNETFNNK